MKKIYLQPTVTVGAMMSLGFIAGSKGNVETEDYDQSNHNNHGVDPNLTPGDGTNFGAKDRGFYECYDTEW